MRIDTWLRKVTKQLDGAGVGTARLDCLVMLEDLLGKDRTHLLAHPEAELTNEQLLVSKGWVERRAGHEPLAYIRGKTEFYGREFLVDKRVLEPRPESETMITLLINLIERLQPTDKNSLHVVDVGTGSGALAITAKLEIPQAKVTGTDIDPKCLEVARRNSKKHTATITWAQGDLLAPALPTVNSKQFIILANLPYVPDAYTINQAALNEPRLAIFGGKDGLDVYRKLFKQIADSPQKPGCVLTESLPFQHARLKSIAQAAGYTQTNEDDFIQLFAAADY